MTALVTCFCRTEHIHKTLFNFCPRESGNYDWTASSFRSKLSCLFDALNSYLIMTSSVCTLLSGHLIPHTRAAALSDVPNICLGSMLYQHPFSPYSSFSCLLSHAPSFLFLTRSCRAVTLLLPVIQTLSSLHHFFFSFSCSLHPIHVTDLRRVEKKDNSLLLCGETERERDRGSKNREGYLSCSILKASLRFPRDD